MTTSVEKKITASFQWTLKGWLSIHRIVIRQTLGPLRFFPLIMAVLSLALASTSSGGGKASSGISAEGSILITNSSSKTYMTFRADVQGCKWRIRSTGTNKLNRTLDMGSEDRGLVYRLEYNDSKNLPIGRVENGSFPIDAGGGIPHLYTFLCQTCYLPNESEGPLTPIYDGAAGALGDPNLKQVARWTRFDSTPMFRNLRYYPLSQAGSSNDPPKNYLAQFEILSFTNFQGHFIPTLGIFKRYDRSVPPNLAAVGEMRVTNVLPLNSEQFQPKPPSGGPFSIYDLRMLTSSNTTFSYISTQGEWPDLQKALKIYNLQ